MNVSPNNSGTIEVDGVAPVLYPWEDTFLSDTTVTLEAIPGTGYAFSNWSGSVWSGTPNPFDLLLNCSKSITAVFTPQPVEIYKVYYPHIASVGVWETEICILNTSGTQTVSGAFKAYTDTGEAASEDIEVTLSPNGRREITVGDEFTDPASIGYIIFISDSDTVTGYMKFYREGFYRVAIPAVSETEINTGDIYITHIASILERGWGTGLSLLNTTSSAKSLTIEFDNGQSKTVDLSANEHKAFLIRTLFEGQYQPDIQSGVIRDANGVVGLEIFTNEPSKQMSGILLKDTTTTTMYYPHNGIEDGLGTGIVAYNPSDADCNITVTPYAETGTALTPAIDTIGGKEHYIGLIGREILLPEGTAWVMIEAESPITGFELFAGPKMLAGYTGVGITGKKGIFAKIDQDGWTDIFFVNTEGATAMVTLKAYNAGGTVIATESITLNAHEKIAGTPESIFTGDISNATYITYSSTREIAGFQFNESSDGMMLDALPGLVY